MNKALQLSIACPTGDFAAYETAVHAFPIVSEDEERELAIRHHTQGDLNAAWQLVTSHLRFVLKIARGYRGYGLPEADIVQEGNVGLMKAVKRFDPSVGTRLASFAIYHIKAEIHDYILRNWRIVKIATTKAQRKLFYRLRSHKKRLGPVGQDEADTIAAQLCVDRDDVLEMDARLSSRDESLAPRDESGENYVCATPADLVADERFEPAALVEQSQWHRAAIERLEVAIEQLDDRSRDIVKQRWFSTEKQTLQELAEKYAISLERVRQIEQRALQVLRTQLADLLA